MRANKDALGFPVSVLGKGEGYGLPRIEDGVESQILGSGKAGRVAEPGLPLPCWGHFPIGQQDQLGLGGRSHVPPLPRVVTAQGETSLLREEQK